MVIFHNFFWLVWCFFPFLISFNFHNFDTFFNLFFFSFHFFLKMIEHITSLLVLCCILIYFSIVKVEEGHVGIYFRGGALLDTISEPGYHLKIPFLTQSENVQITVQTDLVSNIPCGTSGGVVIYFDKIEVVNRLQKAHVYSTIKQYGTDYDKVWIFDKIHHEINQFCSKHTLQEVYIDMFDQLDEALQKALQTDCDKWDTGIDIINIRVTKPKIPEAIMQNYLAVSEEKTQLLVAEQHQLLVTKQEETKRISARIAAQREAEVSKINAEREAEVSKINAQREALIAQIKNEMAVNESRSIAARNEIAAQAEANKIKILAAARAEALKMEAAALKEKLTPEYLRMVLYQSVANNTKMFFGNEIPKMYAGLEQIAGIQRP